MMQYYLQPQQWRNIAYNHSNDAKILQPQHAVDNINKYFSILLLFKLYMHA